MPTVNISFDRLVPFAAYRENKRLGAFIVIDKLTNETVGGRWYNSFCATSGQ
jgi:sulfate adenylyltransferase subunit 1 (EFTu-like GTPase family)